MRTTTKVELKLVSSAGVTPKVISESLSSESSELTEITGLLPAVSVT